MKNTINNLRRKQLRSIWTVNRSLPYPEKSGSMKKRFISGNRKYCPLTAIFSKEMLESGATIKKNYYSLAVSKRVVYETNILHFHCFKKGR
jgi:hypothetical protein